MRNIESKLLGEINDLAYDLARVAENAEFDVMDAIDSHDDLSSFFADYIEETEVEEYFDDRVKDAVYNLKEAQKSIAAVDKTLAKIVALRLKLAHETGIPFNPLGGKSFVRLTEYAL